MTTSVKSHKVAKTPGETVKLSNHSKTLWLKVIIHFAALIPVIWAYYLALTDQYGADPVKAIIHFTGMGALNLLFITLLVSPLAKRLKLGWLMNVRRLLGLYAFFYACLHLSNFALFELQLDFSLLLGEIIERPYITIGMLAFAILVALAVTSPLVVRKKMGRKWQRLHNYVYLLALLVLVHFYWSQKSDVVEATIYFLVFAMMMWWRKDKLLKIAAGIKK